MMMGGGPNAVGIAALLAASAVGYFVCLKADGEKKGSNLRSVGLVLGSIIMILSILICTCMVIKAGYMCKKYGECRMGSGMGMADKDTPRAMMCPKR